MKTDGLSTKLSASELAADMEARIMYEKSIIADCLKRIFTIKGVYYKESAYKLLKMYKTKKTGEDGLIRYLASKDIKFFGQYYLADIFNKPFGSHHEQMFSSIEALGEGPNDINKLLFVLFRGASKSTVGNVLFSLHDLLYYTDFYFIAQISASSDTAVQFLSTIKNELETNELIIRDFGNQQGKKTWKADELILANGNKIVAKGIGSSLRGLSYNARRPNKIILDDLEDDKSIGTVEQRDKSWKNFKAKILPLGKSKGTKLVYLGTMLHTDGIVARLLNSRDIDFKVVKIPAIIKESKAEDLWEMWKEIRTGSSQLAEDILPVEERIILSNEFYETNKEAMLEDTKVAWEDNFDYLTLMVKKLELGESIFEQEMQHNPAVGEKRPFKNIILVDDLASIEGDFRWLLYVDVAVSKDDNADYSSISIGAYDLNTEILLVEHGDLKRRTAKELDAEVWYLLTEKYPHIDYGRYETNGAGREVYRMLGKRVERNVDKFYDIYGRTSLDNFINPIGHNKQKHDRIMMLEAPVQIGKVRVVRKNADYITQVKEYYKGIPKDDAPDSLAGLYELLVDVLEDNFLI